MFHSPVTKSRLQSIGHSSRDPQGHPTPFAHLQDEDQTRMEDVNIDRLRADQDRHLSKSSAALQSTSEASIVLSIFLGRKAFRKHNLLIIVMHWCVFLKHQGYQTWVQSSPRHSAKIMANILQSSNLRWSVGSSFHACHERELLCTIGVHRPCVQRACSASTVTPSCRKRQSWDLLWWTCRKTMQRMKRPSCNLPQWLFLGLLAHTHWGGSCFTI